MLSKCFMISFANGRFWKNCAKRQLTTATSDHAKFTLEEKAAVGLVFLL